MEANDRMQRVIGLEAIKKKAEELADQGAEAFEVRAFIKGARGELAKQKPDWEKYADAAKAAETARMTFE